MKTLKRYLLFPLFLSLSLHAQERVGIGTTNPQAKLHIAGDLQVEDLAGNGERTLVATPEGKIKALTDATPPNSSNADTLRAKFIELVNDEEVIKFIINAHTGQFQMMDEDTIRYEIEVASPPKFIERDKNGEFVSTTSQSTLDDFVSRIKDFLSTDNPVHDNENEAFDLLTTGTVDRAEVSELDAEDETGVDNKREKAIFFLTTSNGKKITLEIDVLSKRDTSFDEVFATKVNSISVKNSSTSTTTTTSTNEGIVETTEGSNIKGSTTTVSTGEGERSQSTEGIDEECVPFESLTDFFEFLNNKKTASESTISNTETGDNVSTQIEDSPNVQFTLGGSTVIINEEEIKQFNGPGAEQAAQINRILQDVANLPNLLQEQNNQGGIITPTQINVATETTKDVNQNQKNEQNTADLNKIGDTDEEQNNQNEQNTAALNEETAIETAQNEENQANKAQLDQLQENLDNASNNTGSEVSSLKTFDGNDLANMTPKRVILQPLVDDGSKGEFTKDAIKLVDSNGETFLIDCEAIKKSLQNKAMGLVSIDLNLDEETLEIIGDLDVFGSITEVGKKIIQIDHPDDPNNQSLQYSPVGTNELLNIYSGNTTTNEQGIATVQLPTYLQSLNTQFRYQLTVIGSFAQAQIAEEINNHQFTIRSSEPHVEVSWQITGVRNDTYAQENPLEVVVDKTGIEKGTVLYNTNTKTFTPVLNRKTALQQQVETADVE